MLNESIRYDGDQLVCDGIPIAQIAAQVGTPVYVYSLPRALGNLRRIQTAFPNAHVHYSIKANGNLALLAALVHAGAGMDAVSAGEIHRALLARAAPERIVFAGVGKTGAELFYALQHDVGWINIENVQELALLNSMACVADCRARVALRLNPDVQAQTHPHIATGHGGAKFGLSSDAVRDVLARRDEFAYVQIEGIHIHIGSQLHDTAATVQAVRAALDLIAPYPEIRTIDIGGGLPVAYTLDEAAPSIEDFAAVLNPLLEGYSVIIEPGRSIVADAGMLVTRVQYVKEQGGSKFVIIDAGMTELLRPALYDARHAIVTVARNAGATEPVYVVGPVCETTDVLARDVQLPALQPGDMLAILTAGAYGMVMASNYNARPRPPEVLIAEDGKSWYVARRRETFGDLVAAELDH